MTLTEIKHITVSLTDEEIKAIELTRKLVDNLYHSIKINNYERVSVNLGYGDYDSLSSCELMDLSDLLSRLANVEELR